MKRLLLVVLVAACGAGDHRPTVHHVATPTIAADHGVVIPPEIAVLLAPQAEPFCSTSSDCGGYGNCSNGKCGGCSTSSDCHGHGNCSSGSCNHCSTSSDCMTGNCSSGTCGGCSTSSDCKGNGTCSNGRCGHCSTSSDCKGGGSCSSGACSNYVP